jgi:hypothetical protein
MNNFRKLHIKENTIFLRFGKTFLSLAIRSRKSDKHIFKKYDKNCCILQTKTECYYTKNPSS